jgi:hypothetical protein
LVATPSAANSNARACTTVRCGNERDLAIVSNTARWSAVMASGSAVTNGMLPS